MIINFLFNIFKALYRSIKTKGVSLPKTYYFNLYYFPIKQALLLPIFVYRKTKLSEMGGKVYLKCPISTGMIQIGPLFTNALELAFSYSYWEVSGTIIFRGYATFGRGTKIHVGSDGCLDVGSNLGVTGRTELICKKNISLGDNVLFSWDILVMDTDYHKILNREYSVVNPPKSINIGNHVWVGCRSVILKGVTVSDNTVIAACSTITKSVCCENSIVTSTGKDIKILKRDINWQY